MEHVEQIVDKLIALGREIGGAGWTLLVQATFNRALIWITIFGFLFLVAIGTLGLFICREQKRLSLHKKTGLPKEDWETSNRDISLIFLVGCMVFLGLLLCEHLPALINPAAETARRLLGC